MKSSLFVVIIASTLFCSAQQPATDPAMVKFFAGNWSCAGEFANGKKIEADLASSPSLTASGCYTATPTGHRVNSKPGRMGRGSAQRKAGLHRGRYFGNAKLFTSDGWKMDR